MPEDYQTFLEQRDAERRLRAKFSQPRLLLLHTLAFVGAVTVLWGAIIPLLRWVPLGVFNPPALAFFVWSIVLAAHAVIHYRRSSARSEARELVVEAEMRGFIESHANVAVDDDLFALHQSLSSDLARNGWLTEGLTVFALVNAASWFGASLNLGTSWGYQLTLPIAVVLVGGVYGFRAWQHSRRNGGGSFLARLPLHHIVVYGVGTLLLAVAGSARMINPWDVDTLMGGWTIVILMHILWSVALAPLFRRAAQEHQGQVKQGGKRKNADRLTLTDDGEIMPIAETDSPSKHKPALHS